MWLSDTSVRRPVMAIVLSLLLIIFGIVAYDRLPLREYPDIDTPIISISTDYRGASAAIVETKITQPIEDAVAGVEGLRFIESRSRDGRSDITLEFRRETDIDAAANDVRDRVGGVLKDLPDEVDSPTIRKVEADADPIMWLNLTSTQMGGMELTDYANRYLVDRFSSIDGVAQIFIGGGLNYSMRIWLDRNAMSARNLTVADIEDALNNENIELPAGYVESKARQFTVRVERSFKTPEDFSNLVLSQGSQGYLVRLKDVADVELAPEEHRTLFRGNGVPMVGLGVVKQSTANTVDVAHAVRVEAEKVNQSLPEGMHIFQSYDSSVFIDAAIQEVIYTIFFAGSLVIFVMFVFLRSFRAMLVPAVIVPVSLIASFIVLYPLGYSLNLLTLLALVLAIGLVVDDAVVVLENIYRHIEKGEPPLLAAFRGTREVGFAVVATTLVLVAVFVPITFMQGNIGRLFAEFAVTLAAAVIFSSLVALTLSPVVASLVLKGRTKNKTGEHEHAPALDIVPGYSRQYAKSVGKWIKKPIFTVGLLAATLIVTFYAWREVPQEFAPQEDRGVLFVLVKTPEGSNFEYTSEAMGKLEQLLMPLVDAGEIQRLLIRAPRRFDAPDYADGFAIIVLSHWDTNRRSAWEIADEVREKIRQIPAMQGSVIMRQGLGGGINKPIEVAIGGPSYDELVEWRNILMREVEKNPGIIGFDHDFYETKPQLRVLIDYNRAADLGVSVRAISQSLETLLGSKVVTTYIDRGEEYDVILQGKPQQQNTPLDMEKIYVRSSTSGKLIPLANMVRIEEFADAKNLNRFNRIRSITFDGNLASNYSLGEALDFIEETVREKLPSSAVINYKGQSLEFKESGASVAITFALALMVVFLVLAAQFESFVHPLVIMLGVPASLAGALVAMLLTGTSSNIYTQVAMIMLIGLSAKNSILIVEFTNQLRDRGVAFEEAIKQACELRLRPILMTSITTVIGAIPLVIASGAGAETRQVIGVVIVGGVTVGVFLTLFLIPGLYRILAKHTRSPEYSAQKLKQQQSEHPLDHEER